MFRKRISIICFAVIFTVLLGAGCGRKEAADSGGTSYKVTESGTAATESEEDGTEGIMKDETGGPAEDADQAGPGAFNMENRESTGPDKAEVFAERVQEAVADRDMEAFADLLSYPCVFITGDQDTIILQKREDLMKQNPDMVFGDDLMVAVANVDTASLKMTKEGTVMGEESPGITFLENAKEGIGITEIRE